MHIPACPGSSLLPGGDPPYLPGAIPTCTITHCDMTSNIHDGMRNEDTPMY